MAILLEVGEVVAAPPAGKRVLRLDDDGIATIVAPDGTQTPISTFDPDTAVTEIAEVTDFRSTALVAAAQSVSVAGLTGETDGDYDIYFYLVGEGNTGAIKLQFNGLDDDLYSGWTQVSGATITGSRSATTCELVATMSAAGEVAGWIRVRSGIAQGGGAWRTGNYQVLGGDGPVARNGIFVCAPAVPVAITSLVITATNAASLAVGSYMTVRKLHRQF